MPRGSRCQQELDIAPSVIHNWKRHYESGAAKAVTAQEVILWPVAGLRGDRPPRTASTPDCTCTHARVRHAFPSCGTDGAWRLRRSSPSRSALSTAHRGSRAGTSWAWALPGRGSWLVSSWGDV